MSLKKGLQHHLKAKENGWMKTVNWESTYSLPFWCSKETKLREFQFKLLHRRIATNDFLYKIGIKQSDSCTFCGEATENLVHLFWSCKYSNAFWKDCYQWIMQNTSKVEKCNLPGALLLGLINDAKDLLLHHLYLLPGIISTPVNKEIRAQMSKRTYKQFNVPWK